MKIYEHKSQFGWDGDNGLGEKLIQQIINGEKTATAGPKTLYSASELTELFASVKQPATVIDKNGNPRCNIEILEVFETKFGQPDARLVGGEGYGTDAEAFKASHRKAWEDLVVGGQLKLDDDTVLMAELFRLLPKSC